MQTNSILACIFDLDGVLVNTAHYHYLSWKQLTSTWGVPFTEQDNEQLKGLSREDSLAKLLLITGKTLTAEEREQTLLEKNNLFRKYLEQMTPEDVLPGVRSLLSALKKAQIRLAVASSSKNAQTVLQQTELLSWFDAVVDGNQIQYAKPNPEVFLLAAKKLNVLPSESIVFEDAQAGIEAALAGGFYCIGVGDAQLLHQAHITVPNLENIVPQELFTQLLHIPTKG
ncbi:MAG: beta-phosphoglucomutase [Thermoflavifilum sp.]|nr:beta-phosphoglucomutase [Thermoflavifilum sp.]